MKCRNCGALAVENSKSCIYCGGLLEKNTLPPAQQQNMLPPAQGNFGNPNWNPGMPAQPQQPRFGMPQNNMHMNNNMHMRPPPPVVHHSGRRNSSRMVGTIVAVVVVFMVLVIALPIACVFCFFQDNVEIDFTVINITEDFEHGGEMGYAVEFSYTVTNTSGRTISSLELTTGFVDSNGRMISVANNPRIIPTLQSGQTFTNTTTIFSPSRFGTPVGVSAYSVMVNFTF